MVNEFQIECFMCVVKHHSFSEAAEEKFLSQPSISKHIKNLETSLGGALFNRKNNQFELTEYGEAMYDFFSKSLCEYQEIKEKYLGYDDASISNVHVAFLQASDHYSWIRDSLHNFIKEYPQYSLSVSFHSFSALYNLLQCHKCDCAIFPSTYYSFDDTVEFKKLVEFKKCIYYNKNAFTKEHDMPTGLNSFKNATFVITDEFKKNEKMQLFINTHGFEFEPVVKFVSDIDNMIWNIKYNDCVAIMDPAISSLAHDKNIRSFELDITTEIVIAWLKDKGDKKVLRFVDAVTSCKK